MDIGRSSITAAVVLMAVTGAAAGLSLAANGTSADGRGAFEEHCAECHPGGDNIVTPHKGLHKVDRDANGVRSAADIIARMRNPGPGMTKFDETMIPQPEAEAIAGYILNTFK